MKFGKKKDQEKVDQKDQEQTASETEISENTDEQTENGPQEQNKEAAATEGGGDKPPVEIIKDIKDDDDGYKFKWRFEFLVMGTGKVKPFYVTIYTKEDNESDAFIQALHLADETYPALEVRYNQWFEKKPFPEKDA